MRREERLKNSKDPRSVCAFLWLTRLVIVRRPASATPHHSRRHLDTAPPPTSENLEFNQLKEILLKKSGVIHFNFEVCYGFCTSLFVSGLRRA